MLAGTVSGSPLAVEKQVNSVLLGMQFTIPSSSIKEKKLKIIRLVNLHN